MNRPLLANVAACCAALCAGTSVAVTRFAVGEIDPVNVRLELDIDLSARLITKLEQGTIDIALLPGNPAVHGSARTSLGLTPLNWMCRPGLLNSSGPVRPEDLANIPIITLSRGANSYSVMTAWFSEAGVVPQRIDYCNSLTVIASLLVKGIGVSLLPRSLFQDRVEAGVLSLLVESPPVPPVEYWAIHRPVAGFPILGRVAELAKEESSFFNSSGSEK